jgi:hypothetical protein
MAVKAAAESEDSARCSGWAQWREAVLDVPAMNPDKLEAGER